MQSKPKIYIEGFRGPWGWPTEFEKFTSLPVTTVEDCDVLIQYSTINWKKNLKYLGKKKTIAIVLDLAEWVGGSPEIDEYVEKFCRLADVVICNPGPFCKLIEMGINATVFSDPSQITNKTIERASGIKKLNRIITFCRLGDPGKGVQESVEAFSKSRLPTLGWKYDLVGPEYPRFNHKDYFGVRLLGFQETDSLYSLVASAKATLMPSFGEGLGLPAIESILIGTVPIVRGVEPMLSVLGKENALYFLTQDELVGIMDNFGMGVYENAKLNKDSVTRWKREEAFAEFETIILEAIG